MPRIYRTVVQISLPVYIFDNIMEIVHKCDRVLRKRKIHNLAIDKTTAKKQKVRDVMNEHNYCKNSEKKCGRWPVKKRSLTMSHLNSNKISVDENVKEDESLSDRFTAHERVLPPLKWIHLIYLSIKNSSRDYVTAIDVQRFVRLWFPYYTEEPIMPNICSTLIEYGDSCLTSPSSLNEDHYFRIWTVHKNHVNVLEEELRFYVEENRTLVKSTMTNPDHLSIILQGYGVCTLGSDQQLQTNM